MCRKQYDYFEEALFGTIKPSINSSESSDKIVEILLFENIELYEKKYILNRVCTWVCVCVYVFLFVSVCVCVSLCVYVCVCV